MKSFAHAFRTTFRRFRWEILGFGLFSCALVLTHAAGAIQVRPPMAFPFQPQIAWGRLEMIAFGWILLHLMASEPVLLTQGGWRTRPISRIAGWSAPFAVLATAVLIPLLLRIILIEHLLAPDASQWIHIVTGSFLPAAGWLLLGASVMRAGASLLSRRTHTLTTKVVFGVVGLIAMAAWFSPKTAVPLWNYLIGEPQYRSGGGSMAFPNQAPGIQELLPPDGKYVGDWQSWLPPFPRMREIFRFPLKPGLSLRSPGIRLEMKHLGPAGRRLDLVCDITAADPALVRDLYGGVMVVRYAGNQYALRRQSSDWLEPAPASVLPLTTLHCISSFDSPVGYIWNERTWDELLQDAEVMIFVPDKSVPPLQFAREIEPPKLVRTLPPGLAGEVQMVFDTLDNDWEQDKEMAAKGAALPPAAIPHILARHPWSDGAWQNFVQPFLLAHAGESDKAAILERLASEPRLGEMTVAKGWEHDALPSLRKFAFDRLPLEAESLGALARERDPALAADLAVLAARLETGVEKLEPLLREQPGFDWHAFVQDGWLRRKYSFRRDGPIQPFNLWAAQQGDFSALRYTAEQAARGEQEEGRQLAGLVAGDHPDLIGYLRENIDRMIFDPEARKWSP